MNTWVQRTKLIYCFSNTVGEMIRETSFLGTQLEMLVEV